MRSPPVSLALLCCATIISAVGELPPYTWLEVPFAHVALSGDLRVVLHSPPSPAPALVLSVARLEGGEARALAVLPLRRGEPRPNATAYTVPCGLLAEGGTYLLRVAPAHENASADVAAESRLARVLDVRWPAARLALVPDSVQTFPERAVTALVEFPGALCASASAAPDADFRLELAYCGAGGAGAGALCGGEGGPPGAPLYSERVAGMPRRREVALRCELFGAAGDYALSLRPTRPQPALATATAYLKAAWSSQFVLNVLSRSVLPCDPHAGGVGVVVQYPACVLERADRVRVFARVPGAAGTLRYVAEVRVGRAQHAARFPCELFSERYPEYCFVYVSAAVTGAVADVRQECVPTLPLQEGAEAAGWGEWSAWSPCSGRCGGARARYRYCDSPPPPYGTPYCKGEAVQSEPCGAADCAWAGLPGGGGGGGGGGRCRCGCAVRLGAAPRALAASAQECRGRTYWLLRARPGRAVRLAVSAVRLPCAAQWLKARDGGSPGAALLAQWPGDGAPVAVASSGPELLLEFFSDELLAAGAACPGGFAAEATQIEMASSNASAGASDAGDAPGRTPGPGGAALALGLGLLLAPAVCWAALRTLHSSRKYQRAGDCDSLADSDAGTGSVALLAERPGESRGTLLSEVLSLRKLRAAGARRLHPVPPRRSWSSCSSITLAAAEIEDTIIDVRDTTAEPEGTDIEVENTSARVENNNVGVENGSTAVENIKVGDAIPTASATVPASPLRRSHTCSPSSGVPLTSSEESSVWTSTGEDGRGSVEFPRRMSGTMSENGSRSESVATLTHGYYSPALSTTSRARVRPTGGKERKDRRNRSLRAPTSDLSLAQPDMELDYYDYNVTNAGAVPGSYLGMDPAFLVWIPPLDGAPEPGSNAESPEESPLPPSPACLKVRSAGTLHPLSFSISDLESEKETVCEKGLRFADEDSDGCEANLETDNNPARRPLRA